VKHPAKRIYAAHTQILFATAGLPTPCHQGWSHFPTSLPRAQCRCWPAEALGARRAQGGAALRSSGRRSRKTGGAIPRGESGLCDPRRSQATTGASVRLTSVAQAHPYSPRYRAKREYERGPFSRPFDDAQGRAEHRRSAPRAAGLGRAAPALRGSGGGTRGVGRTSTTK
jgi:hypothetical protein